MWSKSAGAQATIAGAQIPKHERLNGIATQLQQLKWGCAVQPGSNKRRMTMTRSAAEHLIEQLEDWRINANVCLRDTSFGSVYAALCNLKHILATIPWSITRLDDHVKQ
jgi:hypothetical protein